MTSMQLLVDRIVKTSRAESSSFGENEEGIKNELGEAYGKYAAERGFNTAFKVRGMREGFYIDPSSFLISECGDGNEHGLRIWVMLNRVQIDIMNRNRERIARSLGRTLSGQGIKVNFVTKQTIIDFGRAYLEASREINCH